MFGSAGGIRPRAERLNVGLILAQTFASFMREFVIRWALNVWKTELKMAYREL